MANTNKDPQFTAYIPYEILEALKSRAKRERRSINAQLVRYVEQGLERERDKMNDLNKVTQLVGSTRTHGYLLRADFSQESIPLASVLQGEVKAPFDYPGFIITEAWENDGVWVNAERDDTQIRGYYDRVIGEWVDVNFKLLLIDVDGTLGVPKSGGDFRETAGDWDFFPGRVTACKRLVAKGVKIITVSNQGGVCFPWSKFSEAEITAVLSDTAQTIGAIASLVACSSTHPKALDQYRFDDPRRKPNAGMPIEAMEIAGVGAPETLMVGDRSEDEQAAKAAGVSFMWAKDFFGDEQGE